MSEAKYLGAIVILIALVWGGPLIMDEAEALISNGGIWALFPDLIILAMVGLIAGVIVATLYLAFDGDL